MAAVAEDPVSKLAAEIKDLQKKRGDVEFRLRGLESKEKAQQGAPLLGKRGRLGDNNVPEGSKRFREGENRREDFRFNRDGNGRGFEGDRERGGDRNDRDNRSGRLASVAVGGRRDQRDFRDSRDSRDSRDNRDNASRFRDDSRRPKLSSTIGDDASGGADKRSSLKMEDEETKKRSRNLFNKALVGTLKAFKSASDSRSEAEQRRQEIENKIQQKVKDDQEKSAEEQKKALQDAKEKELAAREELKQQMEQKQLELLNLKWDKHRDQLAQFIKTETKPHIYYKPAKVEPRLNKEKPKEESKSTSDTQEKEAQ